MPVNSVYVGNIPLFVTREDLHSLFFVFGDIKEIEVVKDDSDVSKGFAYVYFEEEADAGEAIYNINDAEYFGNVLKVQRAKKQRAPLDKPIWDDADYHKKHFNMEKQETEITQPTTN